VRTAGAGFAHQASDFALAFERCDQKRLGGDELVTALLRVLVGEIEQIGKFARNLDFSTMTFDLGQPVNALFERLPQCLNPDPGVRQQWGNAPLTLGEQGMQQMLRLYELIVVADCQALGIGDRLLQFGGEFVETHGNTRIFEYCLNAPEIADFKHAGTRKWAFLI